VQATLCCNMVKPACAFDSASEQPSPSSLQGEVGAGSSSHVGGAGESEEGSSPSFLEWQSGDEEPVLPGLSPIGTPAAHSQDPPVARLQRLQCMILAPSEVGDLFIHQDAMRCVQTHMLNKLGNLDKAVKELSVQLTQIHGLIESLQRELKAAEKKSWAAWAACFKPKRVIKTMRKTCAPSRKTRAQVKAMLQGFWCE